MMKMILKVVVCAVLAASAGFLRADGEKPDPNKPNPIYAQDLVDRYKAEHSDLISLGFHAKPPKAHDYSIVAHTTREHIGSKSDTEDLDAMRTDTPNVNDQGSGVFEVCEALRDASGTPIGVMVIKVKPAQATGKDAIDLATKYRDMLAHDIPTKAKLFEPSAGH